MKKTILCSGALAALVSTASSDRVAISHDLPQMNSAALKATVLEVNYGPGEASSPHTHPCAVFGYVLEGAIRSRTGDGPEATYHAGESFYEAPNSIHRVSANASTTEPAKLLAFFVCDNDKPLTSKVGSAAQ